MSTSLDNLITLAEEAGCQPPGTGRDSALTRLGQQLGGVRAALARAPSSDQECDALRRLAVALAPLWPGLGRADEGRGHLARVSAWPGGSRSWHARVLHAAGLLAYAQGDFA